MLLVFKLGSRSLAYFSFFFSSTWVSLSLLWIFSTRSSASLEALSSFFSRRLRRTLASLSSSPWMAGRRWVYGQGAKGP